jgi:hypothetical protein
MRRVSDAVGRMEITRDDVRGRARATALAETDANAAADAAYRIRHPWYRCQALAAAAEAQPDKLRAMRLIDDAFRAAKEQDEINRIVTVASWPLRVCVRLAPEIAEAVLGKLLVTASREPHTLRRGDALHALLFAVKDSPTLKALVLPPLVESITLGRGWRIERLIADVALLVREDHPQYLEPLLSVHRENRQKRKLIEELNATRSR